MGLEKIISELHERDAFEIERQQAELEKIHKSMPTVIARISERSGIDAEMLVQCANEVAWHYPDMPWYLVLGLLDTFYGGKHRREHPEI